MDSISATGRTRQKYDQSCCQHFSNGRISLKNRARFDSRRLLDFRERLGEQLGAGVMKTGAAAAGLTHEK